MTLSQETLYSAVPGLAALTFADDSARVYAVTNAPFDDEYGSTQITVLELPAPALPTVGNLSAAATLTEAVLRASINPGTLDTTYHFEFGPTAAYGRTTDARVIGEGSTPASVFVGVSGLAPNTDYHFRVVATNALGTIGSPDQTFTTAAEPGADSCANAAIRAHQNSGFLPDCRAWEQVSPIDKNGSDAGGTGSVKSKAQSSLTGNSVLYFSNGAFADSQSGGSTNTYISRRGAGGWGAEAILPRFDVDASFNQEARFSGLVSPDLSQALVMTTAQLTPDAPPKLRNLYLRNNSIRAYEAVTPVPPVEVNNPEAPVALGASDDFGHVVFSASNRYGRHPDGT